MNQDCIEFSFESKWCDNIKNEITKYEYAKKTLLDAINNCNEVTKIINKIQEVLQKEKIFDKKGLENLLNENTILKYNDEVNFSIRKINYHVEEKIIISNCIVIFLFKQKNELLELLNNLENHVTIDDINLEFSPYKSKNDTNTQVIQIVNKLLKIGIDKSELNNFFNGSKILYGGELKLDEIRKLREASKYENTKFIIPTIKGILLLFVSSEEIDISTISTIVKDANFYVGAKSDTHIIYNAIIDKNYSEPKVKVILTI